ncbi:outer membrane beta-barrel family protein [Cytophagaceae bacterium YF14B1]|uniref:Outer membrane beta-barrel family protein n=1 Tax=Xanthocytophaga flava TaxID=3048013 RepID=A0AAE3QT16_9BACT|nr:outer membrane beta-barrel family protein [Xanthocytophaga flavus]MDJ1482945.1 outer membrane beta-barrel family protein [Xanthocytophaga flavus]
MKQLICMGILCWMAQAALAQKITVKGNVTDTTGKSLEFATIMLMQPTDSSLVSFTRSEENGSFELKSVSVGSYLFKVTFVGLKPYIRQIAVDGTSDMDLGSIRMRPVSNELDEVTIKGERTPVTIKKDTIEYNAGSFKTKPNGTVEDMIKKMPGIEVQSDGTVKAQGETVKRVTVNGKEFFGRDPKIATRNLPADAIDKVQVYDKKSDQASFSGIDDGQREKTINLELKDKDKKLNFGTFMAGGGTTQRFETKANYNYFDKKAQFSFLGMGNNTNQQGFSMDDYLNFTGAAQRMASGGSVRIEVNSDNTDGVPLSFGNNVYGVMKNWASGINFNNQPSKKTELNGSYFFNLINHTFEQSLTRQNFYPGSTFTSLQKNNQNNDNTNHRLNLTLEHKFDSVNSLKWTSYASYNQTTSRVNSQSQTFKESDSLQNESNRINYRNGDALNLNTNLLLRHRFRKKGRTISGNLNLLHTGSNSTGDLQAQNTFYGDTTQLFSIHQTNDQTSQTTNYGVNFSYTEPIARRKYLEVNYTYQKKQNAVNRKVYDIENENEALNTLLSNHFKSDFTYNRIGMNFRVNQTKYSFAIGFNGQQSVLNGQLLSRDTSINRTFQNLLPVARLNYDFSTSRHLSFGYETDVQEPSLTQLQPVIDNSDPLNISMGNPRLRPEYSHRWRVNYIAFNPANFSSFFSMANIVYTTNKIVYAQSIDANLVRTVMPVNTKEYLSAMADASFGFRIKPINSRINLGTSMTYNKGVNVLNDQQSGVEQYTQGGNIFYDYRFKEILDLSLGANVSYQQTKYEFNKDQNQAFLNETYTAEANATLLKNFQLNTTLNYYIYHSLTNAFNQQVPVWNVSLSRLFLKNKRGELKISCINLLDRSLGVNQRSSVNYLEQERISSLGRYFMLSFTYSLNKAFNPTAGGRGMMRIRRG